METVTPSPLSNHTAEKNQLWKPKEKGHIKSEFADLVIGVRYTPEKPINSLQSAYEAEKQKKKYGGEHQKFVLINV